MGPKVTLDNTAAAETEVVVADMGVVAVEGMPAPELHCESRDFEFCAK